MSLWARYTWSIIKTGYTYRGPKRSIGTLHQPTFSQYLLGYKDCEEKQLKKKPDGFLAHVRDLQPALIPASLDIDVWSLSPIQMYHIPFGVRQGHTRDYHRSNLMSKKASTSVSDNLNRWGHATNCIVKKVFLAHVKTGVTQSFPEPAR